MYSWSICEFVTFFSKLRRPGETQLRTRRFTINRFKPYLRATSQFVRSLTGRREYWIPIVEDFIVVLGPPPPWKKLHCVLAMSPAADQRSTERHRCIDFVMVMSLMFVEQEQRRVQIWANIEKSEQILKWRARLGNLGQLFYRTYDIRYLRLAGAGGHPEKDRGFLHLITKVTDL